MVRRGFLRLLGQRRRALESAEREHRVHRARDHPGHAVVPLRRVLGAEHRGRVGGPGVHDEEHREHEEDRDLGDAEDGAEPGRGPDPVEARHQDDHRAGQRPRPPQVRRVPGELGVDGAGDGEPELQQDERRDQQSAQHVAPRGEEAGRGVQPAGRVRGERPGRRQLAGKQADARRGQQAGDERDEDGQRKGAAGVRRARRDRGRDRGPWCHVGDRLEQYLAQPDRVAAQSRGG